MQVSGYRALLSTYYIILFQGAGIRDRGSENQQSANFASSSHGLLSLSLSNYCRNVVIIITEGDRRTSLPRLLPCRRRRDRSFVDLCAAHPPTLFFFRLCLLRSLLLTPVYSSSSSARLVPLCLCCLCIASLLTSPLASSSTSPLLPRSLPSQCFSPLVSHPMPSHRSASCLTSQKLSRCPGQLNMPRQGRVGCLPRPRRLLAALHLPVGFCSPRDGVFLQVPTVFSCCRCRSSTCFTTDFAG